MAEPDGQATSWRNPVVANAIGVPNTTSIRSGWARSPVICMTWCGACWSTLWVYKGTSIRQVPAWPDACSMAVGDIGGIRGITGLVATGQSVPGGCGRCWVTKNAGPNSVKKTRVRQMLAAIRSGAVWGCRRGRWRGGQERDQLVGDLPGGVAGQPVASTGDQREAGVGDTHCRGARVAGWDEPVVLTGQQEYRAADGFQLPGEVGAGPGPSRLVVLE